MSKKLCALLIFPILLCFPHVSSCSAKEVSALELCAAVDALFLQEDRGAIFYSSRQIANIPSEELTPSLLGRIYTGRYQQPDCCDRISECAVRLPLDESGFEVHVAVALNLSDVPELTRLLEKRLKRMTSNELLQYAPEEYERNYATAELYTVGRYVILLATPDNALAKRTVRSML